MEQIKKAGRSKTGRNLLILCNIVLMLAAVAFVLYYTTDVRREREEMERETFGTTVENMKQISLRYLSTEQTAAQNWAAYIEHEHMTLDEALAYIQASNTQEDRQAHIVDMDSYEAYASDGTVISCYQTFRISKRDWEQMTVENMERLFDRDDGHLLMLGRYRVYETQTTVVSVGTRVRLKTADGGYRPYLLLRVIPVESMKKIWVFPMEYPTAEIGLITHDGSYVIQSNAMRSENFIEFIRSYNFQNDYNGADALVTQLHTTPSGLLQYKNSKGEDCLWYYSQLDSVTGLDIMGYIPAKDLYNDNADNWSVVFVTSGVLLVLALLDGAYILTMNRQLRETAKLAEQASAAKTQFLSSMSHDIRTPLNAVLGMTDLAKKRVDDPQYVQECLNKISVSGGYLLTLINDILELSKVESGKTTITPTPFVLSDLVAELENITRSQADGRGLHFAVEMEEPAAPYLVGDKLRLSQVYLNLLNNAVKYTNAGGSITLNVREETLPDDPDRVLLICTVKDTGLGMSPEFQKTMYDTFSRASDSRIDKVQGTGLGLAIVKRMVDRMDGTIDCQSEVGAGTTFTVRIPLPTAEEAELPRWEGDLPSGEASDLAGLRILVAEDNDLNWEIIETVLADRGIVCDRAENGRLCVEQLHNAQPGTYAMVLMDVQMPEMNGLDATRQLRQSDRADLRTIPIAAMTADAFAEDVQACLDAGMNAHLAKPVDVEKVLMTIRRLRDRSRYDRM